MERKPENKQCLYYERNIMKENIKPYSANDCMFQTTIQAGYLLQRNKREQSISIRKPKRNVR